MATTDIWPVPCSAVIPTDSYTTGGTLLGEKLQVVPVSYEEELEFITKMPSGKFWTDARWLGCNLVLQITLAERSSAVLGKIHPGRVPGSYVLSRNGLKPGKRVTDFGKFLLRPTDSSKPFLYLPRSRVVSIGPATWGKRVKHLEACELLIAAFYDSALGESWYEGDPANFPALA